MNRNYKNKNSKSKPSFGHFNFGSTNKEVNFAEMKKAPKQYYAIGTNADGKEFVLDYEATFPLFAKGWFEAEFASLGGKFKEMHCYQ